VSDPTPVSVAPPPPGPPPPPRGANQLLLMKLCAQFSGSSVAAVWIALTGGATVTE
jgi:hypothetical protein